MMAEPNPGFMQQLKNLEKDGLFLAFNDKLVQLDIRRDKDQYKTKLYNFSIPPHDATKLFLSKIFLTSKIVRSR